MNIGYPAQIARAAARWPIIIFAIKLALVVGTILNLINQGGDLMAGGAHFSWAHCILNYAVPFCVSAFSGGRNELRRERELLTSQPDSGS
jgi:hypothetical protein